jgi:hypothetical protein
MNWKEQLKEMKYSYMERKTPGAFVASGGRSMKLKPYNDTTANGLTTAVIDWINYTGGHAVRINTQGQVRKEKLQLAFGNSREIVRFTPSTTAKGTFDISATVLGRSVKIEVKIGNDRMSDAQLRQQAKEEAAGALCFVARDMQSFVSWYNDAFQTVTI